MKAAKLFTEFFESEKSGGVLLLLCTAVSLALANSLWATDYAYVWSVEFAGHRVDHWVNDGLMAIFFLLIGLELEREIYKGELSNVRKALFPAIAALGGLVVPAGLHSLFNFGTTTQAGAGIPMATDIAFAIGVLALLGSRVPTSLKIFLTALAVIDDLGAILVIAVFFSKDLSFVNLGVAFGIFGVLIVLNQQRVHSLIPYLVGGFAMWYFMLHSGVHATLAGVLLAFTIPFGNGDERSPSYILQHALHRPVAFLILPVFALANTAIAIQGPWIDSLMSSNSIGIVAGLVIGKPLGIVLFSGFSILVGLCVLPSETQFKHIVGVGFVAGIGFTMSIFITLLAFDNPDIVTDSKIAILLSSLVAGIIGFVWLHVSFGGEQRQEDNRTTS